MTDPHYTDGPVTIYHGDCIDVMRELPDNSVDSVVTDPPYSIGFMGKTWDSFGGRSMSEETRATQLASGAGWTKKPYGASGKPAAPAPGEMHAFQAWCEEWATEAYRVLKPGGHLLAFGGTRTFHRLTAGIEDAGFEIRDSIAWMYGSGFPKSLDVSKAIDKMHGAERKIIGPKMRPDSRTALQSAPNGGSKSDGWDRPWRTADAAILANASLTAPSTDAAKQWAGWGTALKPAFEPVVVARKPLAGTVAANVLEHGTGALNIDASRIGSTVETWPKSRSYPFGGPVTYGSQDAPTEATQAAPAGRWPANVVLDETQAAALDAQSGTSTSVPVQGGTDRSLRGSMAGGAMFSAPGGYTDTGGASRFFYTAKAAQDERPSVDGTSHPTVKPVDLMRWLVKLVTPPGGTVLEPFAGSGTTAEACVLEGFHCIAIEREAEYLPLILKRIRKPHAVGLDFGDWDGAA